MALDAVTNFGYATLAAGIDSDDTSITLTTGHGARLPSTAFNAPIWDTSYSSPTAAYHAGAAEIVRVTVRSTDTLTVTRAQEGTTARSFNTSGRVYAIGAALTKATYDALAPKDAAVLTGTTSVQVLSPDIADLGTAASGTVTLSSTKAVNKVVLSGTAATIALPSSPPDGWRILRLSTGASVVTVTVPSLPREDGDGVTAVTTVQFPASAKGTLSFKAEGGSYISFAAAGSTISIPTSQLASVSNSSALDTVDTTQLARSVDVRAAIDAIAFDVSTDGTLADNSDLVVPTEKAVKTYVDANSGGNPAPVTMGSTEVNFSAGKLFKLTLTGNSTLTYANLASNDGKEIEVEVTNTGSYTLSYPATTYWPGGSAPVVTTGAKTSRLFLRVDGSRVLGRSELNYSIDSTAPTLTSLTFDTAGTSAALLFDEAVSFGAGGSGGFSITMSGGAVTLTYASGTGTSTLTYTPSRTIFSGESCSDLDFTQPTDGLQDAAGNELATFTNQQAKVTNNSTATNYERRENFNSAGASPPTDFSVSTGSVTWNYTTSPLEGAQSAVTNGGIFSYTFTSGASSSKWARVIVKPTNTGTASVQIKFRDVSNNVCGGMDLRADGGARVYGGSGYGSITAGTYTWGTTYYITLRWSKGTGSNAQCDVYISTDATRPASPTYSIVNGNNTTDATKLRLEATNANTWFDDIIVSDNEIGSNP